MISSRIMLFSAFTRFPQCVFTHRFYGITNLLALSDSSTAPHGALAGTGDKCRLGLMKVFLPLLVFVVTLLFGTALAAEAPLAFTLPVDSGPELSGQVAIMNMAEGVWKPLAQKLEKTDDGFQGTLTAPGGGEIKIEGHYKNAGAKWVCSLKWESDAETPQAFILANYIIPMDQLRAATMISGKQEISFDKIIEKIPTRNTFSGISEFTLGPIEGVTLRLTVPEQSEVAALLLGENIYVRTFLTPMKKTLPASGTVQWTVEKQ